MDAIPVESDEVVAPAAVMLPNAFEPVKELFANVFAIVVEVNCACDEVFVGVAFVL